MNAGYSWPGVFLLGASGRTGRFFTQLLFHNPHSTTIRQIHLVWQRTKKKQKKNRRILTISTNRTSCISQNRSMVFATVVNWFTCNIFPWVLPVVFIFPDSKKTYFYLTNQNSVTVGSSAHFSDRVDCWICSKVKFLQKNSVIHYWRVYLGYLYFKNNDMLYSVCATIFVQISVNKKFY